MRRERTLHTGLGDNVRQKLLISKAHWNIHPLSTAPSEQTCHTSPTASRCQHPHPPQSLHAKKGHGAQWPSFRGNVKFLRKSPNTLAKTARDWDSEIGLLGSPNLEIMVWGSSCWNSNSIFWQIHVKQIVKYIILCIVVTLHIVILHIMYRVLCTK